MALADSEIKRFKELLKATKPLELFRRHILFAEANRLEDGQHYLLREAIGDYFGVHPSSVSVVGSAKLGFSIKPRKLWQPFNDSSDIDVAVVSNTAFSRFYEPASTYYRLKKSEWDKESLKSFQHFLASGWILFDERYIPPYGRIAGFDQVMDFLDTLSANRIVDYSVKVALYQGWPQLEEYHLDNIDKIRQEVLKSAAQ